MKRLLIILTILTTPFITESQNNWYVKLNMNPRLSWSNDGRSKINPTNSIAAMIGFEFTDRISAETGIYLNRVGYRLERTVERIGVIDGFNSYILEGQIPMKQNFTEKFTGVPLQFNYAIFKRENFQLIGFSNVALNIYTGSNRKWWYYYQTPDEFSTDNTFTYNGKQKTSFSYELGTLFEHKLLLGFSILGGINYLHLFQESKFPQTPKKSQYYNFGGILGLKYEFERK